MQEMRVQSLDRADLLKHSSTLAWEIPQTEDPGRDCGQRVRHDWSHWACREWIRTCSLRTLPLTNDKYQHPTLLRPERLFEIFGKAQRGKARPYCWKRFTAFDQPFAIQRAKLFSQGASPISDCWLLYCSIRRPWPLIQTVKGEKKKVGCKKRIKKGPDATVWGAVFLGWNNSVFQETNLSASSGNGQ